MPDIVGVDMHGQPDDTPHTAARLATELLIIREHFNRAVHRCTHRLSGSAARPPL